MPRLAILSLVLPLTACAGGAGTCASEDLAPGRAVGVIDTRPWEATGAVWTLSGTSVQLVTGPNDGWRVSLVAQWNSEGVLLNEALDAQAFPIEVTLDDGTGGGWGMLYPDDGGSYKTTSATPGTLTLTGMADDALLGCFSFAADRDGATATIEDGAISADAGR
jgi:hypothetical protein